MSRRSRPTRPTSPLRARLARPIVIVIAAFFVYFNSLSGPFVLDDNDSIVNNPAIRQLSHVGTVLLQRDTPIAGRPTVAFSFALNYALSGLALQPYHLTNIALHVLCALLLFSIVLRTLNLPRLPNRYRAASNNLAFAIALLWTVHPLNSETVDYMTERTESMMAFFLLLTLYAAIRSVT